MIPYLIAAACMGRDEHRCFKCGVILSDSWPGYSHHHRKLRSQGGADTMENLIMLCGSGTTGCHGWVHANPLESRNNGWLVSAYWEPAEVPVVHHARGRVLLDSHGQLTDWTGPEEDQ